MLGSALLVGRDEEGVRALSALLSARGVRVFTATAAQAAEVTEREQVDVVFLEPSPEERGGAALAGAVRRFADVPVVVVGDGDTQEVVIAIQAGASNYVEKPYQPDQIAHVIEAVRSASAADRERPPAPPRDDYGILGSSPAIRGVLDSIRRVAPSTATVLVRGESGTGKELVAEAIHAQSPRRSGPLVKMNCAALPDTLLESELFGHERGAFTGATNRKPGRVEAAGGGTLFLDEIGDITPAMQVKLLRLLQSGEFERLGGQDTLRADVRFVAATNRDLEQMIKTGDFRQDLFFRLNVVPIWLPPLRSRRDDIETLARHFCTFFSEKYEKPLQLSDAALGVLRSERWPGNVRELQNLVERLVVYCEGGAIDAQDVRDGLVTKVTFATQSNGNTSSVRPSSAGQSADVDHALSLDDAVRQAEKRAIERALKQSGNNRTLAARLLGVSRAWLYTKLQEHGTGKSASSAD